MRAIILEAFGGNENLNYRTDVPVPQPANGEVLVKVRVAAAAVWDILVRNGAFPGLPQPPLTPGFEGAGVVESVGPGVTRFAAGDDVYGFWNNLPNGAWAEYAVVPEAWLAPMPAITYDEAAGLPVAAVTSWMALHDRLDVGPNDTVLITAASGGVGSIAVQIALAAGARVVATTGPDNLEFVRDLGAHAVINYRAGDVVAALRAASGGNGFLKAFDCVNGTYAKETTQKAVADGGQLVYLTPPPFEAERGINAMFFGAEPGAQRLEPVTALVNAGQLAVHIDSSFPLPDIAEALDYVATGRTQGKVVISIE